MLVIRLPRGSFLIERGGGRGSSAEGGKGFGGSGGLHVLRDMREELIDCKKLRYRRGGGGVHLLREGRRWDGLQLLIEGGRGGKVHKADGRGGEGSFPYADPALGEGKHWRRG
jgi:hypothetical protein